MIIGQAEKETQQMKQEILLIKEKISKLEDENKLLQERSNNYQVLVQKDLKRERENFKRERSE